MAVDRQQRIQVGVFGGAYEIDRAAAEFVQFRGVERRPQQHVSEQLDGEVGVSCKEISGKRDVLQIGACRKLAANRVDRFGKLGGVTIARAFFEQRREQAGEPAQVCRVRNSATPQDCGYGNQWHVGLLAQQNYGAVVEFDALEVGQRHPLGECVARRKGEKQKGNAGNVSRGAHSSSPTCGARNTPTVALLRRRTFAATRRTSSVLTASISWGRSNSRS